MIFKGTKLYELFKKGKYKQITTKDAAEIISEFKRHVERYCRVMRVVRDIPPKFADGGVDRSNLRQYVDELCKKKGIKCKCIRCREIGRSNKIIDNKIYVDEYNASGGKEFFISIGKDPLVGFVRLRFPSKFLRKEITKDSAIVRELHVYSSALKIGSKGKGYQHKGYGKILMEKAEEICKKYGKKKLLVISGIGVKGYYISKLRYKKDGVYVSKRL
jgi:elongator complex protein 3